MYDRLSNSYPRLGDVADIFVGLQTSADDVFILSYVRETKERIMLNSMSLKKEQLLEKDLVYPILSGTDVIRYGELPYRQFIIFPYRVKNEKPQLINLRDINSLYPSTCQYLLDNKSILESREKGKFRGEGWHKYGRSQNIGIQSRSKICIPRLVPSLYATLDDGGTHFLDNVDVGGITLKKHYEKMGLSYLLVLINSKLLKWYFPYISAPFRGGWLSANKQFLSNLPIRIINFDNPEDKKQHDRMVKLVERILQLNKDLQKAKTSHKKEVIQRQINATDKQIDKLVYKLYDLTEEEIAIVEEGTK